MATLLAGSLGFMENSATTLKPLQYQFFDNKTPIHSVVHTYHPEFTELLSVHCQEMIKAKAIPLN